MTNEKRQSDVSKKLEVKMEKQNQQTSNEASSPDHR
jgi:hypothetical protein